MSLIRSSSVAVTALTLLATFAGGPLLVAACSDDPASTDSPPDSGALPESGAGDTSTGQDASEGGRPVVIDCPTPTGGPTMHGKDISADETWTAAGSPHIVSNSINVRDGAKLTIEPCAEVRLGKDVNLDVVYPVTTTGELRAEGSAEHPIRFSGLDGARWGHMIISQPGKATLRHVTFEGGGGEAIPRNATLMIVGAGTMPVKRDVLVDHVTVKGSAGYGVVAERAAGFAPGSTDLVITGSGALDPTGQPYPLRIGENGMSTLPSGTYTGNAVDEIQIQEDAANGRSGLQEDATLHDLGVPYHFGTSSVSSMRVEGGGANGGTASTLTIDPGVVIKVEKGAGIEVTHFSGDDPSPAAIVAVGTAAKPIVFTSAAKTPAAGDWIGISFGGVPNAKNRFDHVKLEYAGADCLCILDTCNDLTEHDAALIIRNVPASGFVTNSTFSKIAGSGVHRAWRGPQIDFVTSNTFDQVTGCAQTLPVPPNGAACPDPRPACP
jgi:hypothetical protein